jgi:hypothetical protein
MGPREAGSGGEATVGRRVMRATGAIALVSLLALGVCASTASAEPLSMTFTEARANVGIQLSVTNDEDALFKAPDTAPFEAQIDPGSGEITDGFLEVPDFTTFIEKDPVDADVTVEFEIGIIDGSFNQATGELTLSGQAGGTLTTVTESGEKECIVTIPETLTLSTAGNTGGTSPLSGTPFIHGLTGAGAIAGQWDNMTAEPANPPDGEVVCEVVEEHIEGPGGVWLEHDGDLVPPSAPQLTSTDPASPSSGGTPRILGAAEAGSTVRVYAGPNCAGTPVATGSAAELGSPGVPVDIAEGVTAAFSATATDAAGNTSACSAPISYTRLKKSGLPPPPPTCIVPELVGKKLKAAKRMIKAAGCKLGKVRKPKRQKGKGRRVFVVKSSNPAAGASPANGKVHLKLGPRPKKAPR